MTKSKQEFICQESYDSFEERDGLEYCFEDVIQATPSDAMDSWIEEVWVKVSTLHYEYKSLRIKRYVYE